MKPTYPTYNKGYSLYLVSGMNHLIFGIEMGKSSESVGRPL